MKTGKGRKKVMFKIWWIFRRISNKIWKIIREIPTRFEFLKKFKRALKSYFELERQINLFFATIEIGASLQSDEISLKDLPKMFF